MFIFYRLNSTGAKGEEFGQERACVRSDVTYVLEQKYSSVCHQIEKRDVI
jgi:hypothetical protein